MILPPAQAPATPLARARRPRGRPARPRLIAWEAFPAPTAAAATNPATDPVRLVTCMGTSEPVPRLRPGIRPTAGTIPAGEPERVPAVAAGTPTARAPIPPALVAQPIAAARPTRPPAHATREPAEHLTRKFAQTCAAPPPAAQANAPLATSDAAAPSPKPAMAADIGEARGTRVRGVPLVRRPREPARLPRWEPGATMATPARNTIPATTVRARAPLLRVPPPPATRPELVRLGAVSQAPQSLRESRTPRAQLRRLDVTREAV
jgi:hypothetical protein